MTDQTQQPETKEPVKLNMEDLAGAVVLLDLAVENGGITGWENVLRAHQVRNNMAAFINDYNENVAPPQEEEVTEPIDWSAVPEEEMAAKALEAITGKDVPEEARKAIESLVEAQKQEGN